MIETVWYLPSGLVDTFGVFPAAMDLPAQLALVHILLTMIADESRLALAHAGGDTMPAILTAAGANGCKIKEEEKKYYLHA